jgi:hypothetical protein
VCSNESGIESSSICMSRPQATVALPSLPRSNRRMGEGESQERKISGLIRLANRAARGYNERRDQKHKRHAHS